MVDFLLQLLKINGAINFPTEAPLEYNNGCAREFLLS